MVCENCDSENWVNVYVCKKCRENIGKPWTREDIISSTIGKVISCYGSRLLTDDERAHGVPLHVSTEGPPPPFCVFHLEHRMAQQELQ